MRFPTDAQRRRGLGPVKSGNAYGLLVHAMIAVDADSQACFRLGGRNCYYKPPGPITFRRGMEQFIAIHRGRLLGTRVQ